MKRTIDTTIWSDPWFTEISAPAKMVFMYLLTNERSTAAGVFDLSPRRMAFDIGIDQSTAEAALMECEGRVRWWPEHSLVWVVNFFRHQAVNENFLKSAQRTFAELPTDVQVELVAVYPEFDANPSSTRTEPMPTGTQTNTHIDKEIKSREIESEEIESGIGALDAPATPEAKPVKKPKAKRATQIPETWLPSVSTRSWAAGEGFTDDQVNGQILRFVDHWRGKGETRKDWDATFRNWMRNAREWGHIGTSSPSGPPGPSDRITSVDQLFAEGVDDESTGYPESSHDFAPSVASEWPGQGIDSGMDGGASGAGLRAIAGGRR